VIFISYRRADGAAAARDIAASLNRRFGRNVVFLDTAVQELGPFPKRISLALTRATLFIAVVTPRYLTSELADPAADWVAAELDEATRRGLVTFPLFVQPVVPKDLGDSERFNLLKTAAGEFIRTDSWERDIDAASERVWRHFPLPTRMSVAFRRFTVQVALAAVGAAAGTAVSHWMFPRTVDAAMVEFAGFLRTVVAGSRSVARVGLDLATVPSAYLSTPPADAQGYDAQVRSINEAIEAYAFELDTLKKTIHRPLSGSSAAPPPELVDLLGALDIFPAVPTLERKLGGAAVEPAYLAMQQRWLALADDLKVSIGQLQTQISHVVRVHAPQTSCGQFERTVADARARRIAEVVR
jgi:hypothetical protein